MKVYVTGGDQPDTQVGIFLRDATCPDQEVILHLTRRRF